MATETRSRKFPDALLRDWESNDWNNWNFGTLGTDVSLIRLERSEAVERLERAAALRGAERLNSWSDWNRLSVCVRAQQGGSSHRTFEH